MKWPMVALGEVLEFAGRPERISKPGSETFVTVKLNCGGAVLRSIKDGKTPVAFTGYRVRPGQFIYSRIDARNGAFALIPKGLDGAVVSKDFPVFNIRSEKIDSRYLLHYLRAGQLQREIQSLSVGATNRQRIAEDRFLKFEIPLPPLGEQRRIAATLERATALTLPSRATLDRLEAMSHELFRSCTGSSLSESIGELLASGLLKVHKDGNHGSLYPRASEFADSGVPFITAKAIRDDGSLASDRVDFLNKEKASLLKIGWIRRDDVLLSHNASVGKVAVYDGSLGEALIGTSLTCFRANTDALNARYLAGALASTGFQRQLQHDMAQTTRNQVPITAQRKLTIPIVSGEAQRQFSEASIRIDRMKVNVRKRSTALGELIASLQSRAFRGEL